MIYNFSIKYIFDINYYTVETQYFIQFYKYI